MHVVQLVERGPLGVTDQPLAFNLFWTSLAVLDPLGALLLNIRPRAGIALTLAIMVADLSVNLPAFAHLGLLSPASFRLWFQGAFAAFAVVCAGRVWGSAVV